MANKLRLYSVQATNDGTGMVAHDVEAVTAEGAVIPGRHQTVLIPQSDLDTVMAMPDSTGAERSAKNQAYKTLIAAELPAGWLDDELTEIVEGNDDATTAVSEVDAYITETLGQVYPVDFNL